MFAGGEQDEFWLELQRSQLERTVGDGGFEHAVYLGHRADERLYSGSIVVGRSGQSDLHEHLEGLQCLSSFALARRERYKGFLVLDSDAFPIVPGWIDILNRQLSNLDRSYAAAVRTENLDVFPHPCIVYAPEPQSLRFRIRETVNLLGDTVHDVGCEEEPFLPLLKSNGINLHPVLATVYSGLFYHHGCGSRPFRMRSTITGYYDPILEMVPAPQAIFRALCDNPVAFVEFLNSPGWSCFEQQFPR